MRGGACGCLRTVVKTVVRIISLARIYSCCLSNKPISHELGQASGSLVTGNQPGSSGKGTNHALRNQDKQPRRDARGWRWHACLIGPCTVGLDSTWVGCKATLLAQMPNWREVQNPNCGKVSESQTWGYNKKYIKESMIKMLANYGLSIGRLREQG
jgi:hypothetical protein